MPFEFKVARTPRQKQADIVKERPHLPTLEKPRYKVPDLLPKDYAALSPYKIGGRNDPLRPLGMSNPKRRR